MGVLDDYLDALDEPARSALTRVRDLALVALPEAEQGTSYGIAVLKHAGKPLLGLLAARNHLSLYPFSADAVDQVRDRLDGHVVSKGTVRFTPDHPIAEEVVLELVRLRAAEIEG